MENKGTEGKKKEHRVFQKARSLKKILGKQRQVAKWGKTHRSLRIEKEGEGDDYKDEEEGCETTPE